MQIFYWAITHLHHVEIKAVRRIVSHESGLHVVHVDEDERVVEESMRLEGKESELATARNVVG